LKRKLIERDVKNDVKKIIAEYAPQAVIFMPVQTGYGKTDLDFIIRLKGLSLTVETKVGNQKPTARQELMIDDLRAGENPVMVINESNLIDLFLAINYMRSRNYSDLFRIAEGSLELFNENA
jgi:hypothetical protein